MLAFELADGVARVRGKRRSCPACPILADAQAFFDTVGAVERHARGPPIALRIIARHGMRREIRPMSCALGIWGWCGGGCYWGAIFRTVSIVRVLRDPHMRGRHAPQLLHRNAGCGTQYPVPEAGVGRHESQAYTKTLGCMVSNCDAVRMNRLFCSRSPGRVSPMDCLPVSLLACQAAWL